jgi:hypothetical protein
MARQDGDTITAAIETLEAADLQPGDVTIRIAYSSVNYKDALALTPRGGVVREYPLVPGIDLTGEVVVPFGTGTSKFTKTSYDDSGNSFRLYMNSFPTGTVLRVDLGYSIGGTWEVYTGGEFKFRVR